MGRLPLEGIRVADFSWIINGPQIAQWLATMGAEVIKIESQVYIDIGRINPSGMADRIAGPNRNGYYHALNYGKKAITLNLATDRGRALADDIIRKSDFVLECFPTPAANKLGITYERVRAVKPDIVMISVSLLGKTGLEPSSWVGWGPMACCFVGMFDAQGYPERMPPAPDRRHLARLCYRERRDLPCPRGSATSQSHRRGSVDRREHGRDGHRPDAGMVHGLLHEWARSTPARQS